MSKDLLDAEAADTLHEELLGGRMTLFTGAGFSCDAFDREGQPIPSGDELRLELWKLCFGDQQPDESSLADLFSTALARRPNALRRLLERRLTVAPASLPVHYRMWLSIPWRRAYSLNADDLESAIARRFRLPRRIEVISALSDEVLP
ncbi:MAG: hypothetical protein ACREQQ_09980, partial [Candidatus Binatia bacterium]